MSKKILTFDLGTGGNKASIYNADGECLASFFEPYQTDYPQHGFHEQRPSDWWRSVVNSTHILMQDTGILSSDISCIAVSGYSFGCVPLDSSGDILRQWVPIWSDNRGQQCAQEYFRENNENHWYRTTGCGMPAGNYPVFKLLWLKENEPELYAKIHRVVGTKDYINYLLTGIIASDHSYASGCGAYNLLERRYEESFIEKMGLPRNVFPDIYMATDVLGYLTAKAASQLGLPQSTPVVVCGTDSSCMAAGAGNIKPKRVYASLGSSAWVAVSAEQPIVDEILKPYSSVHVVPGMYTTAIGMLSAGTTLRWIRDHLCKDLQIVASRQGRGVYDIMISQAQRSKIGANRLMMNPSLVGGASFDASPKLRGGFVGLDVSHTLADIIRATLEGVALNMRIMLDGLRSLTETEDTMTVVGGGSINAFWRQIFADAVRIKIEKSNVGQNAACLGAAAVAAVGTGLWSSFDKIDEVRKVQSVLSPIEENALKYDYMLPLFRRVGHFFSEVGEYWGEMDDTDPEVAV